MNSPFLKKALPHIIALAVFLLTAFIYCKPALEGKVVNQQDNLQWEASNKQSLDYKEKTGHYPLWTNSLFSGMPTFQIAYSANNYIPWTAYRILTLGLPMPIQFFFLSCICFYFLALVMRVNPYIGIIGALAFAYATYNPVIISVGHNTKMWSIAFMPAVLASVLLIYERKYWLGVSLGALSVSILIAMNHLQIDYYLFLVIAIMTVFYVVRWIKAGEWKHLIKAAIFTAVAAVVGVLTNAVTLFSTYEYQKETMRGGSSLLDTSKVEKSKNGLEKDYAFSYSMNIAEPFVLMVPGIYGRSSDHEEISQDQSKAVEALSSIPQQIQQQLPLNYYWGGMTRPNMGEVGSSGPPYAGAIICFLAILGMFLLDKKHKWWILTAIGLSILMSWGSYFDAFNTLLYRYLPFYNKFRAPSMILVIPQLLLPVLAILSLDHILKTKDRKTLLPAFKKGAIATGAIFVILFLIYFSSDFLGGTDKEILKQVRQSSQQQLIEAVKGFFDGLKDDRKSIMIGDILRSLGFIAAAAILIFLLIRNTIKPIVAIGGIGLLSFIDLISVDVKYLNADSYVEKDQTGSEAFPMTAVDQQINNDKGYYRVFNNRRDAFRENRTTYFHNSVGGYHAAKLRIYQDLIEHQFSGSPNIEVLNMLNAKYIIETDPKTGQQTAQINPGALGPAWLVKAIAYVPGPKDEMRALDNFNPGDTAIVQERFKKFIPFAPQWDSSASISLVNNDNDIIKYKFTAKTSQFAVFSEIYYEEGWKAFIDGKETPIVKTDYVLRGLAVPAGEHAIEFRFEPKGYLAGRKITSITSIILILLLAMGIYMEWRGRKPVIIKA